MADVDTNWVASGSQLPEAYLLLAKLRAGCLWEDCSCVLNGGACSCGPGCTCGKTLRRAGSWRLYAQEHLEELEGTRSALQTLLGTYCRWQAAA